MRVHIAVCFGDLKFCQVESNILETATSSMCWSSLEQPSSPGKPACCWC